MDRIIRAEPATPDVSQAKQDGESLRADEERFRLIYEEFPLGYQSLDREGRLLDVNPAWLATFGYARAEVLGRWFGDFLAPGSADRFPVTFATFKAAGEQHEVQYEMIRKDGSRIAVEFDGRIGYDRAGEFRQTHCVVRDITRRKRAEQALQEAVNLAAVGRMAAQVAHEITNPLAGIKNSFSLVKAAVPKDHPDYDMVGRIEREIDRMGRVVRQIYTLYSPQAETPTDISCEETVRDVFVMLEPLRREREVSIELAPISPTLTVKAPDGSLQQVLYNLVANAIQASPPGAVVRIAAERADDDHVRISVCDQGPGIPAAVQRRMFEPFFSSDVGSQTGQRLGLGLSIVRQIVESAKGRIKFRSTDGEGTSFHVFLPAGQPWTPQ